MHIESAGSYSQYFRLFINEAEAKIFLTYLSLINNKEPILFAICEIELEPSFENDTFTFNGYPLNVKEKEIVEEFLKLDLL